MEENENKETAFLEGRKKNKVVIQKEDYRITVETADDGGTPTHDYLWEAFYRAILALGYSLPEEKIELLEDNFFPVY